MTFLIRQALPTEGNLLTDISFLSKQYWNYPKEYFEVWKNELTITADYITENTVFVAEVDGKVVGYESVVEVKEDFRAGNVVVKKGFWLEHIFILPDYIGKGIGSKLITFIKELCREKRIPCLYIFADPYAKGFYDKIGAQYMGESPSSIAGRTVSLFTLWVVPQHSDI
ncbi:GNAT family N-acetyltransferase [Heliobacterium gestii]|uniref:GNAT family N-acetyltransferase n=1 Tax=Heliomicrobium gestii TaxID=2699 RepID=A0A845LNZ1_HELGE|nr:GNAT family N-acetyltransferase [Heliomicrobium gestii]MBM7868478.1 GNAT superfamily N-acetyltransferase [Heliomicrobium gestii]MZP44596.1 GNAT family N-acetyltransferase [Heliomicrobium gestii]